MTDTAAKSAPNTKVDVIHPSTVVQRRRLGPGMLLSIAAVTAVALGALAIGLGFFVSAQKVKAELAKIRASGEPITAADLQAMYALPAETRDATALWTSAVDALKQPEYESDTLHFLTLTGSLSVDSNEPEWSLQDQLYAEQILFKYADVLSELHDAAALGGAARYPMTMWTDADGADAEPQWRLRSATWLLSLEAAAAARAGSAHAAAEAVHVMFTLARSLEYDPRLSSLLNRVANDLLAYNSLERLLARIDLADDDLSRIDADLAAVDYANSFHRSMLGERVSGIVVFNNPALLGDEAPPSAASGIFRNTDFAMYLQMMDDLIAATNISDVSAQRLAVDRVCQHGKNVLNTTTSRWRYPITSLLAPALQSVIDPACRGNAWRDVARMAITADRFRRANHDWPKSLDDLVPEFAKKVPIDPFSGAPLRMIVTSEECRIYSVGADGIDEGGNVGETGSEGDIVFRLKNRALETAASD